MAENHNVELQTLNAGSENNARKAYEAPKLFIIESAEIAGGKSNVPENTNGVFLES